MIFFNTDIFKIIEIEKQIKVIEKKYKKIDILVLNAAICPFRKFLEIDERIFDKVVDTNQKREFLYGAICFKNNA